MVKTIYHFCWSHFHYALKRNAFFFSRNNSDFCSLISMIAGFVVLSRIRKHHHNTFPFRTSVALPECSHSIPGAPPFVSPQPSSVWWYWRILPCDVYHIPAIDHHQDRMTDGGAPHRQIVSPGVRQPPPSCFLHWWMMLLTDDRLFPTLPCAHDILLMCVSCERHGNMSSLVFATLKRVSGSSKHPTTEF